MAGIMVGIDGSHDAHRAMEWAMREAAIRHAPLTVATVHEVAVSGWTGHPIILPMWRRPVRQRKRQWQRPPPNWASPSLLR
jgi:nucleotide-binding universal stress UspA family protein